MRSHFLEKAFYHSSSRDLSPIKKIAILAVLIIVIIVIIVIAVKSKKSKTNNDVNDKINLIKESNNKLQNEINSLNSEISQLSKKSTDLKDQLDKLKKQQSESPGNKELTELNTKYSSLEKEYKEFEEQEKKLNTEIESLEKENKSSEDKIKELQDKLSSLEKEKQNRVKKTSTLADSVILTDADVNLISDIFNGKLDFNLLYRASRDGKKYSNYKSKVGNHKNLLLVGKTDNDEKIGGYTISDLSGNGFIKDKYSFLYNFKKEKKFRIENEDKALHLEEGKFPCFGDGDVIFGPGTQNIKFPKSYKGDELELTGGKSEIKFEDIEIFYLTTSDK